MARAAFVMDRFMHLIGLHGRSFLPLFLGFGCNVPAVMGARVVDTPRARLLTVMLAPLVPCTARLAVVAFLAPAFFGRSAALVSWGLVTLSLVVLVVVGFVLGRVALRGESTAFVMELPLYHLPTPRAIGLLVWQRTLSFLEKAATIMVGAAIVVWALSYFPGPGIAHSYMAVVGQILEPAGRLVGLNWQLVVALLTSVIAKENSVATLGILYGGSGADLPRILAVAIAPASALAYLVVQMLFVPCVATLTAIRQEAGVRWMGANLWFLLVVSLGVGGIVYAVASVI
jgi:ferrous iron transport protein B